MSEFRAYELPPNILELLKEIPTKEGHSNSLYDSEYEVNSETEGLVTTKGTPFLTITLNDKELLVYKQLAASIEDLLALQGNSKYCILLLQSGHFSGAIFDKECITKSKAFHRYTTRKKQGGAQSMNDQSKGKANSVGAQIRRYNEQQLIQEITSLMEEWSEDLKNCLIFCQCPPQMKSIFNFETRNIPFVTKRPTIEEAKRCFDKLTTSILRDKVEIEIPVKEDKEEKPVKEQTHFVFDVKEEKLSQNILDNLDAIKRGKKIEYDVNLEFSEKHGFTFLHYASSISSPHMISHLLHLGADPTKKNSQNKRPYDLCLEREAREVFIAYRAQNPTQWDYTISNIPVPLTEKEKEEKEEKERLKEQEFRRKQRELRKKKKAQPVEEINEVQKVGKKISLLKLASHERETLGMTPEQRQRYEREKRAMAVEARMRSQQGNCATCGEKLPSKAFEKSVYKYCSMECLKLHGI